MRASRLTRLILAGLLMAAAGPGRTQEQPSAEGFVNFSFDQVEIRLLVKLVGEMTGRRFVVDDKVTGKVTVVTPGRVRAEEVYPLFVSVLESSGYSVAARGGLHHVVPLPEAKVTAAPLVGEDGAPIEAGVITKILKVEHISVLELKPALQAMVRGAGEGGLAAVASTNHLILTDTRESVTRIENIVAALDQPGASRLVEVIGLVHADAAQVAAEVMAAMKGAESVGRSLSRQMKQVTGGGASLPAGLTVVPSAHANSLIVVGTPLELEEVKRVVSKMDVEAPAGVGRLNAIFLKYLSAQEAAESINALLGKKLSKDERREIAVEPSPSNNALLIDASPRDFELVKKLVEELDQIPQQVLVEILIAEIAVGTDLDLGVELATIDVPADGRTTVIGRNRPGDTDTLLEVISQGLFPQGLTFGVARGTVELADGTVVPRMPFIIRALAEDREVKILSNVPLWAQDNKEATVSVVDNIPVLRSTVEAGAGTARDVIQNIDRVDVGIKLTFTPHVNPDQEVLMELNPSIEAIVDEGPEDQPFTPTIAKREVSTTVTVPDNATVVISGLIREDRIKEVSKIPILGDLPLLGHAFRRTRDRKQRTNLLIFVTPHIVTDLNEAESLRRRIEEKAFPSDWPPAPEAADEGG